MSVAAITAESSMERSRISSQLGIEHTDRTAGLRRLGADAVAALEPYCGSLLLAEGQINVLSLDAIARHLGPKWATRRDPIYDYTARILERGVGESGAFLRISDTDFLVVLPDVGKLAAQARCLHYLREVLTYFLGEARPVDVKVLEVTGITENGLVALPIDPTAISHREQPAEPAPPMAEVDRWTPFVAANGVRVRVSCALEPVFELKHYGRIGDRIVRRVLRMDTEQPLDIAELQRLTRGDIEKIDLATIARGLDRLRAGAAGGRQQCLIIPVSYISLSHRQSRAALADLFEKARAYVRTGVICEICDIENVPQGRLLEATSLIRPFCVLLVGRLSAAPDRGLDNLRGAGLNALSFDMASGLSSDAEFAAWAKSAITAARRIVKSVMIYRLDEPRRAGIAALLGATHVGLSPAQPKPVTGRKAPDREL